MYVTLNKCENTKCLPLPLQLIQIIDVHCRCWKNYKNFMAIVKPSKVYALNFMVRLHLLHFASTAACHLGTCKDTRHKGAVFSSYYMFWLCVFVISHGYKKNNGMVLNETWWADGERAKEEHFGADLDKRGHVVPQQRYARTPFLFIVKLTR